MPAGNENVPPGWIGGFAESNPAFAYPDPNLKSLPMLDNMANIRRIKRQQKVYWPEFSWQTILNDESSRCFQRFAHDISSIGYDNTGRIWSIICPQQGACTKNICFNVEVTVTGQRGWINETNRELAADMTVEGKIWFSPSVKSKWWFKIVWDLFAKKELPFPIDKENAIQVSTHAVGKPHRPIFTILNDQSPRFDAPWFAQHKIRAWDVGHIDVQIGGIVPTGNSTVDAFNQKVLDIFNIATGNMLLEENVLTWNLWFTTPEYVNTLEWKTHAALWRLAIDADHGPNSSPKRYADGSIFEPSSEDLILTIIHDIIEIAEELL
ncbi:MAG: hypothetical protein J7647_31965 [Cyanobacteria bacterium SBLK]|nr:hypothetical protein [Cyanobacteria bacterium SBLK]